jgi:hypothetical protein
VPGRKRESKGKKFTKAGSLLVGAVAVKKINENWFMETGSRVSRM